MKKKTEKAPGMDLIELQRALAGLWAAAQRAEPDLPAVVLIIGQGSDRRHPNILFRGRFSPFRWVAGPPSTEAPDDSTVQHEVFIAGERMADGGKGVGATLLHEAAHALALARKIKDTSREGRYHNKHFAGLARSLGLAVEQAETRGWTSTSWTEECDSRFGDELEALEQSIHGYRRCESGVFCARPAGKAGTDGEDPEGGEGTEEPPKRGRLLAKCSCDRSLRVARGVYEAGPILCGLCGEEFVAEED